MEVFVGHHKCVVSIFCLIIKPCFCFFFSSLFLHEQNLTYPVAHIYKGEDLAFLEGELVFETEMSKFFYC